MPAIGILLALGALLGWGLGDFFIQKTSREVGDVKALFYIGLFGGVILFPFVMSDLQFLGSMSVLIILILAALITFFSSLFDFEALKKGKIAVIEPIISLELPFVIALSFIFRGERASPIQWFAMALVFAGILLSVSKGAWWKERTRVKFERGIILAGLAAVSMALYSFLIGVSSENSSPILTIWFIFASLAVLCFVLLTIQGRLRHLFVDAKKHLRDALAESFFDTGAWVCYAAATVFIPISIATTISESYVALAVLLGLLINKEKIKRHQLAGVVLAFVGVIVLAKFA